jgi:hypothetical protein
MFNIRPRKSCRSWQYVKKYCKAGQATYDNMEHVHCMLLTWGYKHTLRIYNTYCFSIAPVVARTRLSVAICVHCLYCYRRHGRTQMTYMCLSKLLMVTFRIVSTVLRVRRLCLYFMRVAVCEPRLGTRRYYPPLVSHALLEVLTPLCSRLGCESVFTWFRVPRQYSPVEVNKSARSLKVKVLWDTEIFWVCHQFQWLPWRWKQQPVDTMSYSQTTRRKHLILDIVKQHSQIIHFRKVDKFVQYILQPWRVTSLPQSSIRLEATVICKPPEDDIQTFQSYTRSGSSVIFWQRATAVIVTDPRVAPV